MQCPKCSAEAVEGKKFCKACGAALANRAQTKVTIPSIPSGEDDKVLNCPRCGSTLSPGRSFCRRCGAQVGSIAQGPATSLRISTPSPVRVHPRKPINWRKGAVTVGIPAIVAVLVAGGWHFMLREPLPPQRAGTILDRATVGTFARFTSAIPSKRPPLPAGLSFSTFMMSRPVSWVRPARWPSGMYTGWLLMPR